MNRNTHCYYNSAIDLWLPAKLCPEVDGFALKLGKKRYFFRGCETPFNDGSAASISQNKYCTNKVLESAGIPVPKAEAIHINDYHKGRLAELIAHLKFPLVAKPLQASMGENVLCNIQNIEQLKKHIDTHLLSNAFIYIEEFHGKMNSYRVLVFNRRIIGVIQRFPALVQGDGQHTIAELITLSNARRNEINDALGPIVVDEECQIRMNEQGITLDSIPKAGETLFLGYTSNATRGGIFEALDTKICKKNKKLMIQVANLLGLNLVGIDVECPDINQPITTSGGVIIETNHDPSIKIHENPLKGTPNRVSKRIIRSLIYRHPIAYMGVLYKNKYVSTYLRGLLLLTIAEIIYLLFGS